MALIITNSNSDKIVGRKGTPASTGTDQEGQEYSYEFKYKASAEKAIKRLEEAGIQARIV